MTIASLLVIPVTRAIESAFNRYLSLDPEAQKHLRPLLGKVVQIDVSGAGLPLIFIFNEHRVEVCNDFGADADVVISGPPVSLAAVASGRTGLMQSSIVIDGEVDTASRFSQLLERIDVDWEEHISAFAGDTPAHLLSRLKKDTSNWVRQFQTTMERNVADYLRDETRHLPHQWEMDEFIEEVDAIRDRVDVLLQRADAMDDLQR